jgi:hypothetical protein
VAGVQVFDPLLLPVRKENLDHVWIHAHVNGKRGSGSRVMRCFPIIHKWEGEVAFEVYDTIITEEQFRRYLIEAGKFIGVGRFRPRNGGFCGRFRVAEMTWEPM